MCYILYSLKSMLEKRKVIKKNCKEEKVHLKYCTYLLKKYPCVSGPMQFKLMLFKDQACFINQYSSIHSYWINISILPELL